MTWDTIQQLVRIIMQVVAGMLVQQGFITDDMSTQLVGGTVSLVGIAWWVLWQRKRPTTTTT